MIVAKEVCKICGNAAEFHIGADAVLLREARCSVCGASLRNSDVAEEIISYIGGNVKEGLKGQAEKLKKYKILNTCSSGYLHETLSKIMRGGIFAASILMRQRRENIIIRFCVSICAIYRLVTIRLTLLYLKMCWNM